MLKLIFFCKTFKPFQSVIHPSFDISQSRVGMITIFCAFSVVYRLLKFKVRLFEVFFESPSFGRLCIRGVWDSLCIWTNESLFPLLK